VLTAFDHLILAVRDLAAATEAYRRLGFDVQPGGRNPQSGTHNAIIRFGVDYLELLSIEDAALAREHAPSGRELHDYLERRPGGAVGYVVQSDDIEADANRAAHAGFVDISRPIEMRRTRPDGIEFAWRLLIPGDPAFRRPWPFLIQWETNDRDRLTAEPPGDHANGATGVQEVVIAVRSLPTAIRLYRDQLGLPIELVGRSATLAAWEARARLTSVWVRILAPATDGPLAREITEHGEGPFQVSVSVADLAATRVLLADRGVTMREADGPVIAVDPTEAFGARIVFTSQTRVDER
jgi:catechol 2,3-dioxygenase-like lactoylglutathione lyase family enzyme